MLILMNLPVGDTKLVQIVDAAFAEAARRSGDWLVCRPGCTQCCHGAFTINVLDALRLRSGMQTLRATQSALAEVIELRACAWLDEHLPSFPGDPATGLIGTSEEDQESFEDFANQAPCPALDPSTGLCDVYEWRPMTCRVFGPPVRMGAGDALGCCELCFKGADDAELAACEMPVPHEFEARLLSEIGPKGEARETGETLVAFALLH